MDEAVQSVLFVSREAYVYRLPPRTASAGYKASDWNVESFLWKGRLRVLESTPFGSDAKSTCEIRLEDADTGELFASCPYAVDGKAVEPVLDSSRYFVLAVQDPGSGKRAYLGMGFPERTEAFDFNVSLQDWVRQQQQATKREKEGDSGPSPHLPDGKARDFSLKPNETISIAIGGGSAKPKPTTSNSLLGSNTSTSSGGAMPLLPPPPSAAQVRKRMG